MPSNVWTRGPHWLLKFESGTNWEMGELILQTNINELKIELILLSYCFAFVLAETQVAVSGSLIPS